MDDHLSSYVQSRSYRAPEVRTVDIDRTLSQTKIPAVDWHRLYHYRDRYMYILYHCIKGKVKSDILESRKLMKHIQETPVVYSR